MVQRQGVPTSGNPSTYTIKGAHLWKSINLHFKRVPTSENPSTYSIKDSLKYGGLFYHFTLQSKGGCPPLRTTFSIPTVLHVKCFCGNMVRLSWFKNVWKLLLKSLSENITQVALSLMTRPDKQKLRTEKERKKTRVAM